MSTRLEQLRKEIRSERRRLDAFLFIMKGCAEALRRERDPRSIYGRCNLENEEQQKIAKQTESNKDEREDHHVTKRQDQ